MNDRWSDGHPHAASSSAASSSRSRAAPSRCGRPVRRRRSSAATPRANGATGAPTPGARATRRSTRSTRSNFNSLQVAWQWNARCVRRRRVLPHDAALRERPAVHRRDDAPQRVRDRSRDRQDAVEVGARRRHPLAEGAAPVRRTRPRVLDRRRERARRSSSRPAITWRRSTRRPASPIRSSARTASSISMEGSACRSCRSRWTTPGPLDDQRRRAGAQGQAGRERGIADNEDRRRRHHRHRSGARADRRQLARRSSSATSIIVGNSHIHGYYPIRLRNMPGWIRGFDIRTGKQLWKFNLIPQPGEFGADTWKNGLEDRHAMASARTTRGRPYSADPELGLVYIPVGMPLMRRVRRPSSRRQPVRQQPRRARREDRQAASGISRWSITTSGTTTRRWRRTCWTSRSTASAAKIVAQTTKQGWIYTFDRVTGEPIWPMPETPVLQSDVPGEADVANAADSVEAAPYSQQGLDEDDLIDYTPAIKDSALQAREAVPHGTVLHSRRRRWMARARHHLLVVRARRERRREHRRRRRGRSRDRT